MIELNLTDFKPFVIGPAYKTIGDLLQKIDRPIWDDSLKVEVQPVDELGNKIGTACNGFFEPSPDKSVLVLRLPYAVFEIVEENSLAAFLMTERENGFGLVCTAPLKVARSFPVAGKVHLSV